MPDIIVTNQAQLDAALKAAKGGESIKLAAGNYTSVKLNGAKYASTVTISSLDVNNMANIEGIDLYNCSNISFKSLTAKKDVAGTVYWDAANVVQNSKNIAFSNMTFSGGSGDPKLAGGTGIAFSNSTNVVFSKSSIDHYIVGLAGDNVDGLSILNSSFHDNRRDHTNFSQMSNMLVDNNVFTNLFPINGEHPDALQFMTTGKTKGNTNITISNNVIMDGDGLGSQGMLLNEEAGNLPYENVTIKNNLVYDNGYYQGIYVKHGTNVVVDSNTVVSKIDSVSNWIRLEGVTGGVVSNNVSDQVIINNSTGVSDLNNASLSSDSVALRKLWDLNAGASAKISNLLMAGKGYQPPAGSAIANLVAQEQALSATAVNKSLLLDLTFGAQGMTDLAHWSSNQTMKPIAQSDITGNMYHIQTGGGFEIDYRYSRQIFSLPAFTVSFDMKRDSASATTGQVMGIFQSWSISLRSDGELVFSMFNDTKKQFTLTTSGAKITDTANHKIGLTYDSVKGQAVLYVDGAAKGSVAVSGSSRPVEYWGLVLGNSFGAAFSGSVGNVEIREGALSAAELNALNVASSPVTPTVLKSQLSRGLVSLAATMVTQDAATKPAPAAPLVVTRVAVPTSTGAIATVSTAATNMAVTAGALSVSSASLMTSQLGKLQLYHA